MKRMTLPNSKKRHRPENESLEELLTKIIPKRMLSWENFDVATLFLL